MRRWPGWRTPASSPPCPTARLCCPHPPVLSHPARREGAGPGGGPAQGRLLREHPLSLRFRRVLPERQDAAAVIYRLAAALAGLGHPVRFRWRRALPQDATVVLPDGRMLAMVRQGGTAERTGFAKRLWRLAQGPRPGAILVIAPDEVRRRQARQLLWDLENTASVQRFIAALNRQARKCGWDVEQLAPHHRASHYFRHYGAPRSLHPDAFGTLRRGDALCSFFLEYERRAVRPATTAQRLALYLRYHSSHRPADDHGQRPLALVVFDAPVALTHFLEAARREMERVRVPLPLLAS